MNTSPNFRLDEETHCYYVGEQAVPGVNEVLGVWKRIKIKKVWYHVNTFDGATIPSLVMKRCANTGSQIHDICAQLARREDPGEIPEEIEGAVNQYRLFLELFNVKPLVIEGSFYSKKHNYAGTLDLFAEISGKECEKIFGKPSTFCVLDVKTGKLSWTAGPQMAAYLMLLEESEDWPKDLSAADVDRGVISLPRDGGSFTVVPMKNPKDKTFFLARRWEHLYRNEIIEKCKRKAG